MTASSESHESRGAEILAIAWVFTGLAIAVVALRFFVKARISKELGLDDLFILLSIVTGTAASIFVSYPVRLGLGRHTAAVLAEPEGAANVVLAAKVQMIGYPFNILAFTLPNVAIAILVNRLLDPRRWRTRVLFTMSVLQVLLAIVPCIIIFAQCKPIEKLWDTSLPGNCWDSSILNDITYFMTAYTILVDIALAVMPITAFWKLNMKFSTKLGLCVMMGLTLLSAIVTIIKSTYLYLFTDKTDPLWNVVPLVLWGLVEQNVVVVAACVPPVRPLFSRGLGHKHSSRQGSGFGSGTLKLSNLTSRSGRKPASAASSKLPLDDRRQNNYAESNSSKEGIWKTVEVGMRWEDDTGEHGAKGSKGNIHAVTV